MDIFLKRHVPVVIIAITLVSLAAVAFDTAYLKIDLTTYKNNHLQVFWAGSSNKYAGEQSVRVRTSKGRKMYTIPLENALWIKRVRIDLQEEFRKKRPKPVILHSISYDFKWFFYGNSFQDDFADINFFQGIKRIVPVKRDRHARKIFFSHGDPALDFKLTFKPVCFHFLLPVLALMFLHFIFPSSWLKGRKNTYRINIFFLEDEEHLEKKLYTLLRKNRIKFKVIQISIAAEKVQLQMAVTVKSIASFYEALTLVGGEKLIKNCHIVANRSGEIV